MCDVGDTDGLVQQLRTFNDLVSALQAYEWAGTPRTSVLEKATSGAASILGLGETTGTIAPPDWQPIS